ncbi:hypothetical protein SAMN05216188_12315 [Lentzea xinjiangensis]|uniref:Uncharacterized protein n=1 Tax=Lentzea xinjiangensis TaxID=402600 RepID=A0A1H9UYZ3_9PSEU|nr:hypothetical protein [Lentzea xinjiangensis]SES14267.1 hypothetical protein SAMN05216188_12315 [Lentzea xinjiangensis]
MWKVPVTAPEALPYIVDAARREGYLGLIVVLARTAEARTLHEELIRDWTSIHDVTGQRIAVLCPDPEFVLQEQEREGRYFAVDNPETYYWKRLTLDDARGLDHTVLTVPGRGARPRGKSSPFPPRRFKEQQAAWTEAVTRCAHHFGVPEARLPAVLVLCLRDDRDVLVRLRPETSIYRLCKGIASHPGHEPGDGDLMDERDALKGALKQLGTGQSRLAQVPVREPLRTTRALLADADVGAQFEGLRKHLGLIAPEQAEVWRRELDELAGSDTGHDAVLCWLTEMIRSVRAHPDKVAFLGLDKKARKAKQAVEQAVNPPLAWRHVPETPAEKAERERECARAQARLREVEQTLASRQGLAAACESAAKAELGDCEVDQLELEEYISLRRGHRTERIHVVTPIGPSSADHHDMGVRNHISGTVHGIALQAEHVDTLHIHPRRRWFPGLRWRRER